MSDWRDWGHRGVSVVDASGRPIDTYAVRRKGRFFVRYAGAKCVRCQQYLRITELAEFLPSGDKKQVRHVTCPDGSPKQT